jgi:hypothetical protein
MLSKTSLLVALLTIAPTSGIAHASVQFDAATVKPIPRGPGPNWWHAHFMRAWRM